MEQSPSCEANSFSASQEDLQILCNPPIHKRQAPVPILSQINPEHAPNPPLEDPF